MSDRPPRWLLVLNHSAVWWPLVILVNLLQLALGSPLLVVALALAVLRALGELGDLRRFTAGVCWLERNMIHPVGEWILTACARFRDWQNALADRYGLK